MKRKTIHFFLAFLLVGVLTAQAADFWEKKDFHQWSLKECRKMLEKSPWAKQRVFVQVVIETLQTSVRTRAVQPRMVYQAQFRSALPIRRAMVRLQQIQLKYDKMTDEQKQAFDDQVAGFLNVDTSGRVVVYVSYGSNVRQDDLKLARFWQNQTLAKLRNNTYLMGARGVKVELQAFSAESGGGRGFQLTFPRLVDGKPLVGPKDKSLQLEFPNPQIRGQGERRVLLSFKVKNMKIGDEVLF